MLKRLFPFIALLFASSLTVGQQAPKLVIGLVVDQMTNDYLYRFNSAFGDHGFNKIVANGYYFPNTTFSNSATSTGPGHATIYTGTNPNLHGIMENRWLNRKTNEVIYCVQDSDKVSPKNLISPTITDMLTLSGQGKSKVISLAMKDRSAILPGGHAANLALWWDDKKAEWVTNDYYVDEDPEWLKEFNETNEAKDYLGTWLVTIEDLADHSFDGHDEYEEGFKSSSDENAYDFVQIAAEEGMSVLKSSPFGNTYTIDFARHIIEKEKLGLDYETDFLCISLSSADYIGHRFGPYSLEVFDSYKRLDLDITGFLAFLDREVGFGNYLLFLTSDHGVVPNVDYLKSKKLNAEWIDNAALQSDLSAFLKMKFGNEELILGMAQGHIYFDKALIKNSNLKFEEVSRTTCDFLNDRDEIACALSSHDLTYKNYTNFPQSALQQSFYRKRSGDVMYATNPLMRSNDYKKGSGHGTPYFYDKNVPLIFYGAGIRSGYSFDNVDVTQIAATLADLLQIQRPPSCTANSLADKIVK